MRLLKIQLQWCRYTRGDVHYFHSRGTSHGTSDSRRTSHGTPDFRGTFHRTSYSVSRGVTHGTSHEYLILNIIWDNPYPVGCRMGYPTGYPVGKKSPWDILWDVPWDVPYKKIDWRDAWRGRGNANRIRRCIPHYHTPLGLFSIFRYLHSQNVIGAKQVDVGKVSLRVFRRRIVRYWHILGCRAIYTVVYGKRSQAPHLAGLHEYEYLTQQSSLRRKKVG